MMGLLIFFIPKKKKKKKKKKPRKPDYFIYSRLNTPLNVGVVCCDSIPPQLRGYPSAIKDVEYVLKRFFITKDPVAFVISIPPLRQGFE